MKILYLHNSLPEYRYGYFLELNKICDLTIVFTDMNLGKKIYDKIADDERLKNFNHIILKHDLSKDIKILNELFCVEKFDFIVLPAPDDLYSIRLSKYVVKIAKKLGIKTGLFWEKWRPCPTKQPIIRRFKERIQKALNDNLLKNIDIFWSPGRKTNEYLTGCGIDESKIPKIYDASECYDTKKIDVRKKYNIPSDKIIILFLGRFIRRKGADKLIEAFAQTSDEYRNKHFLLLAGTGDMEDEWKQLAKDVKLENYCFVGFVDPLCRKSFFDASDIFVQPAWLEKGRMEAWGLTINEAIQCDNVVIATDIVASAFELINKNNGLIVEEGNVNQLRDALVLSDKLLENKEHTKINKEISNKYTYKEMALNIINGINSVLNKN